MLSPSVAVRQTLRRARPPAAGSAWIDPVELVLAGLAEQPAALEIGALGGVEGVQEGRGLGVRHGIAVADLGTAGARARLLVVATTAEAFGTAPGLGQLGRASCRDRVCHSV